jgi:hypothetical protein
MSVLRSVAHAIASFVKRHATTIYRALRKMAGGVE